MSVFAIVDKRTGNLMFKKENSNMQFFQPMTSEKVDKLRKFPYLLKMIFKNKLILGVDIVVDIENTFEQIVYETEPDDVLKNFGFVINGTQINGEKYTNIATINDVKKIDELKLTLDTYKSINGNFNIEIQYSFNKDNWFPYDTFEVNGKNKLS